MTSGDSPAAMRRGSKRYSGHAPLRTARRCWAGDVDQVVAVGDAGAVRDHDRRPVIALGFLKRGLTPARCGIASRRWRRRRCRSSWRAGRDPSCGSPCRPTRTSRPRRAAWPWTAWPPVLEYTSVSSTEHVDVAGRWRAHGRGHRSRCRRPSRHRRRATPTAAPSASAASASSPPPSMPTSSSRSRSMARRRAVDGVVVAGAARHE